MNIHKKITQYKMTGGWQVPKFISWRLCLHWTLLLFPQHDSFRVSRRHYDVCSLVRQDCYLLKSCLQIHFLLIYHLHASFHLVFLKVNSLTRWSDLADVLMRRDTTLAAGRELDPFMGVARPRARFMKLNVCWPCRKMQDSPGVGTRKWMNFCLAVTSCALSWFLQN